MRLRDFHKIAFYHDERAVSFGDVIKTVGDYTQLFSIRKKDRVVIFSENRPEWVYTLFGAWHKGATVVPADFSMPAEDLNYIVNNCKPKMLFTSEKGKALVTKALRGISPKPKVIVFEKMKVPVPKKAIDLEKFPERKKDETALIIYTSGTTGNPKGVMLSFDNLQANIESIDAKKMIQHEDVILNMLPFHHILPLQGNILMPFALGCTTIFLKSLEKEDIFRTLQKYKATMLIAVPRIYELFHNGIMTKLNQKAIARLLFKIAKAINSLGFSRKIFKKVHDTFGGRITTCVSGGAKLDEEVARNLWTLGFRMVEGYGTSETAPMITFNPNELIKLGSVGQAITNNVIKIQDGEIIVKGRNVMQGYYKNATATNKVLKKGWYHTGDTGYFDKDNYLYISGRKDEMIVLPNGKNINPENIESSILGMTHMIKEIGVLQNNGQLVAIINPDFTALRTENIVQALEEIRDKVIEKYNSTVANYKKIFQVRVTKEDFPRTRLGKLKRFLLPDFVKKEAKAKKPVKEPDFQEYKLLKDFMERLKGDKVLHFSHLEYDVGMDSLDKVELQAYVERTFGFTITETLLHKHHTLSKLAELVRSEKTGINKEDVSWGTIMKEDVPFTFSDKPARFPFMKRLRKYFAKRFTLEINGLKNLPDKPCIIAPNHESYLDVLMINSVLPEKFLYNTYYWVKDSPIMPRFVKLMTSGRNMIILNLEKDLKGSLQKSGAILKGGRNLVIFPEGSRTLDGSLGSFKKAFAIISRELNIPIVPVAIKGAFKAMPKGKKIPRKEHIRLSFLKPIKPGKISYQQLADKVRTAVEKELQK